MLVTAKFTFLCLFMQEVKSLHPCIRVTNADCGVFHFDSCIYTVYLDKKPIFTASKLSNAFIGLFALFFVFGVHYPRSLKKTCTFIAAHVVGLQENQLPTVQALFNKLSPWVMKLNWFSDFFQLSDSFFLVDSFISCGLLFGLSAVLPGMFLLWWRN